MSTASSMSKSSAMTVIWKYGLSGVRYLTVCLVGWLCAGTDIILLYNHSNA